MDFIVTVVISHIWLDRWPSSRGTTIYTVAVLDVNLLQLIVDWLISVHSVYFKKWRLVLRILLSISRFPLLWIDKITVLMRILLYKGLLGDELFWLYGMYFTQTKFIDRIFNLLVLLNFPKTESEVISILKDAVEDCIMKFCSNSGSCEELF